MALVIRTNGKDRPVKTKGELIDIAGRVREALAAEQRDQKLAATGRAVSDAAQAGDIKRARQLARRLTRQ